MPLARRTLRIGRGVGVLLTTVAALLYGLADVRATDDETATGPQTTEFSQAEFDFFEKSVRPVLVERCQECHNADNPENGLSVDHLADLLKGGSRGPALVPGKPEQSLLIRALSHGDVELQMPPKAKIPLSEIAAVTDWIRRGAPWPGERASMNNGANTSDDASGNFTPDQRNYWAFRPPTAAPLPAVRDTSWVRSPIDHFVLCRLEAQQMSPAPPAEKRTLIRRVFFDLLGLPPTPDDVAAFLSDDAPDAYERLIDRCLASPHYGERWGRYWLDIARYADSNGLDENLSQAHAYRYRDYVIAALNADKPYDVFIHEQLAGDLLNADPATATTDVELAVQRVVATGFLSLGAKMLAEDDPVKMQMDIIDEQVDTLGKAFMGLTFGCARCHDHKFDPFTQRDYYGLAGIFKSTTTMEHYRVVARWQELPVGSPAEIERYRQQQESVAAQEQAIAKLHNEQNDLLKATARANLDRYLLAARRAELISGLAASAGTTGDVPASERPAGTVLREAEQFDRGNVAVHTSGYGEAIGVLVNQEQLPNFVEYDVEIPQAGLYQAEVRFAAAESRPVRMLLNGEIVVPAALSEVTGSWYPDTQAWRIAGFLNLVAGANTLRIERDGPFPHIDKLLLAPVAADKARTLAELTPPTDDPPLHAAFIEHWRKMLGGPLKSDSPLLPAQRAFQGLPADEWFAGLPAETQAAFGAELPQTFADLAARYAAILRDLPVASPPPTLVALRDAVDMTFGPYDKAEFTEPLYPAERQAELKQLQENLTALRKELEAMPEAMAVSDAKPENVRIHFRGSHLNLGAETTRAVPAIFRPTTATDGLGTEKESGRLELARWLTGRATR
ncbi:MAG: DUF1549 domain-containing protein [Planctomycetaceae bacterium]